MNQKQCKRMFEQMQPPEAVVQRLQQRIRAEEDAIPSHLRTSRKSKTTVMHYKSQPSKPFSISWKRLLSGTVTAVFLLGIGVGIGYYLRQTPSFVPSSESEDSVWSLERTESSAASDTTTDSYLYYNDTVYARTTTWEETDITTTLTLTPETQTGTFFSDRSELEGIVKKMDSETFAADFGDVLVYEISIDNQRQKDVVVADWNGKQYFFVQSPETATTFGDFPVIATASAVQFSCVDADRNNSVNYQVSASEISDFFDFCSEQENNMNLLTGLVSEAEEQNVTVDSDLVWTYAITLDESLFGFSSTFYFNPDGFWCVECGDQVGYFISDSQVLTDVLSTLQKNAEASGEVIGTTGGNSEDNGNGTLQIATNSSTDEPPMIATTDLPDTDTFYQELLDTQSTEAPFTAVSGLMETTYDAASSLSNSTTNFQIDITNRAKSISCSMENPSDYTVPTEPPEDADTIYTMPLHNLSTCDIWLNGKSYLLYPDLLYRYPISTLDTSNMSDYDFYLNAVLDGNDVFGTGIFYLVKDISTEMDEAETEIANSSLLGSSSYLGRDCYIFVQYQDDYVVRYLIDQERLISLKRETICLRSGEGEFTQCSKYFTQIAFDDEAESVTVNEHDIDTLLSDYQELPDYVS